MALVHRLATLLRSVAAVAAMLIALSTAGAQTWPSKPIRLIVPFAPGGANDIVARLLQPSLEKALGQPIVVENRPGASGVTGTDAVAKSPPDGHTLGVALATHSVNPAVNPKMPYDTEKDLSPIILIGKNPLMFVVNANVPAKTLAEFAALAKANPEKYNYSTPGAASQAHLVISQWSNLAGVRIQHVPYRGGAPAIMSTVSGETQFSVMSSLVSAPHIQAGKLRALAVGSLTRDPKFPDVPTVVESGYPGVEAVTWVGMFAPAGTPRPIIDRLNAEINRIIREPEIKAKLDQQGIVAGGGTPEEFAALISAEIKRWTAVARANNISLER
ncbi:MAG TPA: tripartite tricarboxylate transporter substrate binding protein [Xanthobacteraceae bacterium]|nr:tripartite tricarboxylate transporter substrate binding protein [Xanthobacteraceae bacterium]